MMQLPKTTELDPTEVGQSSPASYGSVWRRHALAPASMGGYLDLPLFPVNTLHRFFDREGSAGAASTHMEQAPTLSVARDRPQQE